MDRYTTAVGLPFPSSRAQLKGGAVIFGCRQMAQHAAFNAEIAGRGLKDADRTGRCAQAWKSLCHLLAGERFDIQTVEAGRLQYASDNNALRRSDLKQSHLVQQVRAHFAFEFAP